MALTLRPVIDTDLPIFFAQQADPVANAMAVFGAARPDDAAAFGAKWARIRASPDLLTRTVVVEDAVAGYVAHFPLMGQPSIAYWLGRAFWGRGIASTAVAQFIATIPTRPLYARVAVGNTASARVLARTGFRAVGRDRGHAPSLDRMVEEEIFRLDAGPL
ncbi:GNAT family N-acetyltransferase [Nitrospirillum sp. BR 11163]|uniref:GNAT family N-acetyltransferase n=1 Tax=Nitrospirillum sp. BR 11163 TaxID=3104323 RepID=UPI002B002ED6|nr:GNAT family N-acetyltransferase [Nitrospirillum sp. BR 11163]MEA1673377.1 GNAT family N-acetyltransferase [Nitrospirillum sp. BR 11163]